MKNFYKLVSIFLYIFIVVISLIDFTTIFNTIITNIEFRKQEFAIFRSIGMTSKEFNRMIGLESIFIGLKTIIYSLPTATILCLIIHHIINAEIDIEFNFPYIPIIISFIFISIFIYIIMIFSLNKLKKH